MAQELVKLIAGLKEQEAIENTLKRLNNNEDPNVILAEAREGMAVVGERFAKGEYFIPDLIYSGEILRQVTDMIKPKLVKGKEVKKLGKIVLGNRGRGHP